MSLFFPAGSGRQEMKDLKDFAFSAIYREEKKISEKLLGRA